MERHNCGGVLQSDRIALSRDIGQLHFVFEVPGKRCRRCHEGVISRDTARVLEDMPIQLEEQVRRRKLVYRTISLPLIQFVPDAETTYKASQPRLFGETPALTYVS